ncbi:XrtA/PEP-CTERM system TPR-repeat protein PrsT [Thalassotalea castellviae]|uniref:PEP-CTERM system TPR-repeat protein PrsT n=1 Tax=Thalassotalea castellviae TaxID=3075612 RepID=A0ABU2ZYJ6_9GAMM|nr:XrtA/PEP-CTERM system TPR-repeat protein PrsT [Thalassotalea sp. W431]MDT0602417.1 PEP-CTERM system TPR-repeat protein PrsT [Thalassotalea sp. W431]
MTIKKVVAFSVLLSGSVIAAQSSSNEPFENALKSFYMEDLNSAVIHLKNALKNNPKHLPSRILMAEILIAQGDGAGAEIELKFAEQGNADDKKTLLLLLEAYLLQNKYDLVINKATPIPGSEKLSSDILVLKGRALFNKNNTVLAQAEYQDALELNPRNYEAFLGLAQVAYKRNQYEEALKYIEQTLKLSPLNTNAMQMKASIYQIKGDIDQAIKAISEAIAINVKHFPALLTRASILIEQQKFNQALDDVNVILADVPNEPRANYLKAIITNALGLSDEFSKTTSHLDVVLTGMPDDIMKENPIYYYLAGLVNFNQGEFLKAQDDLRDYIDIVNDDIRAMKLIAQVEFALNEAYSAKNYLIKARLLNPDDIQIWTLLGKAYDMTGEVEKAELYFTDVVKALPKSASAHFDLGNLQLRMGQSQKALENLIKAEELSQHHPKFTFQLVKAFQQSKQYQKALTILVSLIEKDKNSSFLYLQQGILQGLLSQHSAARSSFEQAVSLDENNIDAIVHLARMDMVEGDIASARERLLAKLSTLSDHPMLMVELGNTYTQKNEIDQAQKYYEKAYSLNRNSTLAVNKVLDIYSAKGDIGKAIEVSTEFLARNNKNAQIQQRLAGFYLANKNFDKASNSFQLAVKYAADKSAVLSAFADGQLTMRNPEGAISSLQKSIAWNENFISAYLKLIHLLAKNNQEDEALAVINSLNEKLNFPALILSLKGDVYLQLEKFTQAEQFYRESLSMDKSQKTTLSLSQALIAQEKFDEATSMLFNLHATEPKSTLIAIALADVYMATNKAEQAATLYEKQININGSLPILLNNAAIVNIALDRHDKALKYAKEAYDKMPDNVAIMDTMAWALTKSDQPDKALNIFRNVLAVESDNAEVKYHLAVNLVMLKRENEAIKYLKEAIDSTQSFSEIEQAKALLVRLES